MTALVAMVGTQKSAHIARELIRIVDFAPWIARLLEWISEDRIDHGQ